MQVGHNARKQQNTASCRPPPNDNTIKWQPPHRNFFFLNSLKVQQNFKIKNWKIFIDRELRPNWTCAGPIGCANANLPIGWSQIVCMTPTTCVSGTEFGNNLVKHPIKFQCVSQAAMWLGQWLKNIFLEMRPNWALMSLTGYAYKKLFITVSLRVEDWLLVGDVLFNNFHML